MDHRRDGVAGGNSDDEGDLAAARERAAVVGADLHDRGASHHRRGAIVVGGEHVNPLTLLQAADRDLAAREADGDLVHVGGGRAVRDGGRLDDLPRCDRTEHDAARECLGRREGGAGGRLRQVGFDRAEVVGLEHLADPEVASGDDHRFGGVSAGLVVGEVDADRGEGHEDAADHGPAAGQPPMTLDLHGAPRPLEEA